jgi:arylsulfatase
MPAQKEDPEALAPASTRSRSISSPKDRASARGGTGVLTVDGKEVANQRIPHTFPNIMPWDETFDVGVDTRTPVEDKDYQVPFRFTGTIDKVTFKLEPMQLTSAQ